MSEGDYVKISVSEYEKLKESHSIMRALEFGHIEEYYYLRYLRYPVSDQAMKLLSTKDTYESFKDNLIKAYEVESSKLRELLKKEQSNKSFWQKLFS